MKTKEPSGGKGFGHIPPHVDRKIFGDLAVTFLKVRAPGTARLITGRIILKTRWDAALTLVHCHLGVTAVSTGRDFMLLSPRSVFYRKKQRL